MGSSLTLAGGGASGSLVVSDIRPTAKFYALVNAGISPVLVATGDSTTEQMAGSNNLNYDGTWPQKNLAKNVPPTTVIYNRGASGAKLADFVLSAAINNAGGFNCNMAAVSALNADGSIFCWGINDTRQQASIAGQAYGSSAQIAFANVLRGYIAQYVSAVRAVNPNHFIIWRVPNAVLAGNAYLANGVTAQNMMDCLRLTYLGDPALGLAPLTDIYPNTTTVDVMHKFWGDKAPVTSHPMLTTIAGSDGLHPATAAYMSILRACLEPLNQTSSNAIASQNQAQQAASKEKVLGETGLMFTGTLPVTASTVNNLTLSGLYDEIGAGVVNYSAAGGLFAAFYSEFGSEFSNVTQTTIAYGAASGALYGATQPPAIGLGDVFLFTHSDGTQRFCTFNRAPDASDGTQFKWYGGSPDGSGTYPFAAGVLAGDSIRIFRHKYSNSEAAKIAIGYKNSSGVAKGLSYKNYYRLMILGWNAGTNTLTVQAIGDTDGGDFTAHDMTTSDVLCWCGADGGDIGLTLTGATFGAKAATGVNTITLTNPNFATAIQTCKQAILLSNT